MRERIPVDDTLIHGPTPPIESCFRGIPGTELEVVHFIGSSLMQWLLVVQVTLLSKIYSTGRALAVLSLQDNQLLFSREFFALDHKELL